MRVLAKERRDKVANADNPQAEVKRLWKFQRNQTFDKIRHTLRQMAPGHECCMYCESNEGSDIEHFWPKMSYPSRAFEWENYLWACSISIPSPKGM